ncbi:hypothetical protein LINGRAHAP2_LOCUS15267 [Linum grandiflorum]
MEQRLETLVVRLQ